jgi:hypothetical protein
LYVQINLSDKAQIVLKLCQGTAHFSVQKYKSSVKIFSPSALVAGTEKLFLHATKPAFGGPDYFKQNSV